MHQTRSPRHRVLLVREWDQQMGGSGCCGRLDTDSVGALREGAESPFAHHRPRMERIGAVYQALRDRFDADDVEITVVDPRNSAWLLPAMWRDARGRGLPVGSALRQVSRGTASGAVVCDGVVVATDPTPQEAVAAVEADLASPRSPRPTSTRG